MLKTTPYFFSRESLKNYNILGCLRMNMSLKKDFFLPKDVSFKYILHLK